VKLINDAPAKEPPGWLRLLALLMTIVQPLRLAFAMAEALAALPVRGASLALVSIVRLAVAGVGVAAGMAILNHRENAIVLAKWAIALSAAMDVFIYMTSYVPNNRAPGDTPLYIAASLTYHAAWLLYLFRSARVREMFR
jgi:hypothetical protein